MGQRWQSPRQRGHRPGRRRSRSRVYVQLWGLKFPPANFRAGQGMQAPVVLGNVTDRTCCHFNYNSTWASACVDAYIGMMQLRNAAAKGCREGNDEIARLGFIRTSSSQKVGRGEQKPYVGSEKRNYSDDVAAIIGKHGGHQRSSAHGDDQIGARRSFSGKKKKNLSNILH